VAPFGGQGALDPQGADRLTALGILRPITRILSEDERILHSKTWGFNSRRGTVISDLYSGNASIMPSVSGDHHGAAGTSRRRNPQVITPDEKPVLLQIAVGATVLSLMPLVTIV